jgi:hypothetical protein
MPPGTAKYPKSVCPKLKLYRAIVDSWIMFEPLQSHCGCCHWVVEKTTVDGAGFHVSMDLDIGSWLDCVTDGVICLEIPNYGNLILTTVVT